jgi:hypothetical protein
MFPKGFILKINFQLTTAKSLLSIQIFLVYQNLGHIKKLGDENI